MNSGLRIKSSKLYMVDETRKMMGFTHESIAFAMEGMSRTTVSHFFNGRNVSVVNFHALCRVLHLNVLEVVHLEDEGGVQKALSKSRLAQKLRLTARDFNDSAVNYREWIEGTNSAPEWSDINDAWQSNGMRYLSSHNYKVQEIPFQQENFALIISVPKKLSEDFDFKVRVRYREYQKTLPLGLRLAIFSEDNLSKNNGLLYEANSKNDSLELIAPIQVTEFSQGGILTIHLTYQGFSFTQPINF